jgi:hypothetical protein
LGTGGMRGPTGESRARARTPCCTERDVTD